MKKATLDGSTIPQTETSLLSPTFGVKSRLQERPFEAQPTAVLIDVSVLPCACQSNQVVRALRRSADEQYLCFSWTATFDLQNTIFEH